MHNVPPVQQQYANKAKKKKNLWAKKKTTLLFCSLLKKKKKKSLSSVKWQELWTPGSKISLHEKFISLLFIKTNNELSFS
jgi:hypothetical protein